MEYTYLPRECQTGTCDHEPTRCTRYRSRRCLSGECTHARQNLMCGINYPETATSATSAETEDQDGPPCGKCGHTPAEHLGWNRGHLWIRSMHYPGLPTPSAGWGAPTAEVQHPQGAEATATPSGHLDGCCADEDPDGETMCVCADIAAQPKPDPREEEECTPELIDGRYYGCGICEACNAVQPQ